MNIKTVTASFLALIGLNLVVVVHELGHFFACKLFGIATPLFSIGFGTKLAGIQIGSTFFQLALLPLGGYVSIDETQLAAAPYLVKVIIILAGIANNFIFAFVVFTYFRLRGIARQPMIEEAMRDYSQGLVGPIGILSMIKNSAQLGASYYFVVLALLSMSVGFFNFLPLPFLDGGQLFYYTIEAIFGTLPAIATDSVSIVALILLLLFFVMLSFRDVLNLRR